MNKTFFIGIDDGKLILRIKFEDDTEEQDVEITSYTQLRNLVGKGILLCSSSLDWPNDYTDDIKIIALCDLIRGNSVAGEVPEEILKEIM